ncbi:MAG: LemA family protein [Candidatus Aminicenantes bacterium]|nr:LemA family protein [Candidatus Aminicenantes bacterium]MCK5003574.1 LemA family protein [Candidatus Aminicenantes bacterium]
MNKKLGLGCGTFLIIALVIVVILVMWGIKVNNNMVAKEENVKEKWSQVENVYQRRFDLIPNLVATVKGYAEHEKETFIAVTEARSKVGGQINVSDDIINNPQALQQFQQLQSSLGSALQRLMVVVEKYPDLKANENFLNLQNQLEGTENRIAVERRRFNEAAREFNTYIKVIPNSFIASFRNFKEKAYFLSDEGAKTAPKVEF